MEASSLTQELFSLAAFAALSILAFLFGKSKGYYSIPEESDLYPVRLLEVFIGFGIYIFLPVFILPHIFYSFYPGYTSGDKQVLISLHFKEWFAFAMTSMVACIMLFVAKTPLLKESIKWNFDRKSFFSGITSWFWIFPQVAFTTVLATVIIHFFFGEVEGEQGVVTVLKLVMKNPALLVTAILLITLGIPIMEEILFRGLLQNYFKTHMSKKNAILLTSILFALIHYSPSQGLLNFVIVPGILVLSILLGVLYERRQNLWAPIGTHFTINLFSCIIFIYKITYGES